MNPTIKIKLDAGATMPRYAHPTDVGADVTALRTWLVELDGTEYELQTYDDCFHHIYVNCKNYAKLPLDSWHPLPAESGQQSNLPPTAGQQMHQDLFNTNGN